MIGRFSIFFIALVVAGVFVTLSAAFIVDQREQVLVLQFGDPRRVVAEPGLYFKMPFIQRVVRFDNACLILIIRQRK